MFPKLKFAHDEGFRVELAQNLVDGISSIVDPKDAAWRFSEVLVSGYSEPSAIVYPLAFPYGQRLATIEEVEVFATSPEPVPRRNSGTSCLAQWWRVVNEVTYGYVDAHDISSIEDGLRLSKYLWRGQRSIRGANAEITLIEKLVPHLTTPEAVLKLSKGINTFKALMVFNTIMRRDAYAVYDAAIEKTQLEERGNKDTEESIHDPEK